jgi:hypothetical protein
MAMRAGLLRWVAVVGCLTIHVVVSGSTANAALPGECPFYQVGSEPLSPVDDSSLPPELVSRDGTRATTPHEGYSPGLDQVAFVDASGLVIADADGSNPVTVVAQTPDFVLTNQALWSPDGRWVIGSSFPTGSGTSVMSYLVEATTMTTTLVPARFAVEVEHSNWNLGVNVHAWSPDALHVVVSGASTGPGLSVVNLAVTPPTVIPIASEPSMRFLGWSDDGVWVAASVGAGGTVPSGSIELVRRDGAVRFVVGPFLAEGSWSWRGGSHEFAVLEGSQLERFDADTGASITTPVPGPGTPYRQISFSPDGGSVAWSDSQQIWRMNLTTGASSSVQPHLSDSVYVAGPPAWSPDGSTIGITYSHLGDSGFVELDAALLNETSVVRLEASIASAYDTPNGPGTIYPFLGEWSPDGSGFLAIGRGEAPLVAPMFNDAPIAAVVTIGQPGRAVWRREARWVTCQEVASAVVPIANEFLGTVPTTTTPVTTEPVLPTTLVTLPTDPTDPTAQAAVAGLVATPVAARPAFTG